MVDPAQHVNLGPCTTTARLDRLGSGWRSPPNALTLKPAPQRKNWLRRQLRALQFRQLQKFHPAKEGGGGVVVVVVPLNLKRSGCGRFGFGKSILARVH